jgi:hypothetical protein
MDRIQADLQAIQRLGPSGLEVVAAVTAVLREQAERGATGKRQPKVAQPERRAAKPEPAKQTSARGRKDGPKQIATRHHLDAYSIGASRARRGPDVAKGSPKGKWLPLLSCGCFPVQGYQSDISAHYLFPPSSHGTFGALGASGSYEESLSAAGGSYFGGLRPNVLSMRGRFAPTR